MISFSPNSQLNLSEINASDIQKIVDPSVLDHIERFFKFYWEAIQDAFCSTDYLLANKLLHDLFSQKSSEKEKIHAWIILKMLAGDGYKDNFQIELNDTEDIYTFRTHFSDDLEDLTLSITQNKFENYKIPIFLIFWDSLKDAFCEKNQINAYYLFKDLLSQKVSDKEKIQTWFQMKTLADDGYKDKFPAELVDIGSEDAYEFSIDISEVFGHLTFTIAESDLARHKDLLQLAQEEILFQENQEEFLLRGAPLLLAPEGARREHLHIAALGA